MATPARQALLAQYAEADAHTLRTQLVAVGLSTDTTAGPYRRHDDTSGVQVQLSRGDAIILARLLGDLAGLGLTLDGEE